MDFEDPTGRETIEQAIDALWAQVVKNTDSTAQPATLSIDWDDLRGQMNMARKSDAYHRYISWVAGHRSNTSTGEAE
jgi:hypothetical protein